MNVKKLSESWQFQRHFPHLIWLSSICQVLLYIIRYGKYDLCYYTLALSEKVEIFRVSLEHTFLHLWRISALELNFPPTWFFRFQKIWRWNVYIKIRHFAICIYYKHLFATLIILKNHKFVILRKVIRISGNL